MWPAPSQVNGIDLASVVEHHRLVRSMNQIPAGQVFGQCRQSATILLCEAHRCEVYKKNRHSMQHADSSVLSIDRIVNAPSNNLYCAVRQPNDGASNDLMSQNRSRTKKKMSF